MSAAGIIFLMLRFFTYDTVSQSVGSEVPLSSFAAACLPLILFAGLGLPLAVQDLKDNSVSLVLLLVVYAVWSASTTLVDTSASHLVAASIVLLVGALLLVIFPDRLGEADVIFMSGMALFFPFWSLMIAFGLACIGALSAFAWLSRGGRVDVLRYPLPLLPSLYWAGLTVILGRIRF